MGQRRPRRNNDSWIAAGICTTPWPAGFDLHPNLARLARMRCMLAWCRPTTGPWAKWATLPLPRPAIAGVRGSAQYPCDRTRAAPGPLRCDSKTGLRPAMKLPLLGLGPVLVAVAAMTMPAKAQCVDTGHYVVCAPPRPTIPVEQPEERHKKAHHREPVHHVAKRPKRPRPQGDEKTPPVSPPPALPPR